MRAQHLTMNWSWRILFLVVLATGKGFPQSFGRGGEQGQSAWLHPLLFPLHRCPLPGAAGAVWGWGEEARGICEGLLQGIWVHLHQLCNELGATGTRKEPAVHGMDQHEHWESNICPGLLRSICFLHGHLCQHSLSTDQQPELWGHSRVLLCKRHDVRTHILPVSETCRRLICAGLRRWQRQQS